MRARLWKRRLSVSAARMTVRSHVPWPIRIVAAAFAIAAAVAAGNWLSRSGTVTPVEPAVVARLAEENRVLREERDHLVERTNTEDSRRAMQGSTLKELGEQIARLEAENSRLKEDVAFFDGATADRPSGPRAAPAAVAIRRFQVVEDKAAGVARYRILLIQDSRAVQDFAGELQLVAGLSQAGKAVSIAVPESNALLAFRSYKRIDGSFDVPAGAALKSVQAKVLERGALRAQQTVSPT